MHIVVIGMGYVGIPCAALLADVPGFHVTGVQRRSPRSGWKIDALNQGRSPFEGHEPGLAELLQRVVLHKRTLCVTDDYSVCRRANVILLDVQTPVDGAHAPQYDSLRQAAAEAGRCLRRGALVVVESTVAPGTTQHIVAPILEQQSGLRPGADFSLAASYERVMPGRLLEYLIHLPRVVGGIDHKSTRRTVELYRRIVHAQIIPTDCLTAELAKTVENTYRDVNIAFANEMALVCESLGVDVFELRRLVNSRPDRHMHLPGAGVGGHCLPKDPWLLNHGANTYGCKAVPSVLLSVARGINERMPVHMADLAQEALAGAGIALADARVTVLGVAYLEDSDDTRNTPAAPLIRALRQRGAQVTAHDPFVRLADWEALGFNHSETELSHGEHKAHQEVREAGIGENVEAPGLQNEEGRLADHNRLAAAWVAAGSSSASVVDPPVRYTQDLDAALRGADCAVLVTKHRAYLGPELLQAAQAMRTRLLVDGRGCLDAQACSAAGIVYSGVGRPRKPLSAHL